MATVQPAWQRLMHCCRMSTDDHTRAALSASDVAQSCLPCEFFWFQSTYGSIGQLVSKPTQSTQAIQNSSLNDWHSSNIHARSDTDKTEEMHRNGSWGTMTTENSKTVVQWHCFVWISLDTYDMWLFSLMQCMLFSSRVRLGLRLGLGNRIILCLVG